MRSGFVAALVALAAAGALGVPDARAAAFTVSAAPAAVRPVNGGFVGLALEYDTIPQLVASPGSVDPVLVQLVRELAPRGRPVIRIGGLSTDHTWWPVPGLAKPIGITYPLTPIWARRMHALAAALDARVILGLGLEANVPRIDAYEARRLIEGVGRGYVSDLEIGNEPELYRALPWYRTLNGRSIPWYEPDGTPVFNRGPGYGPGQYVSEFGNALAAVPHVPIAGPVTGSIPYLGAFARSFLSPGSRVRMLTWHAYGANECDHDPSSSGYPTIAHLLPSEDSRGILAGLGPYIGSVHHVGGHFRIDETGPVSCNGQAGVSNTFASALWLLDTLFAAADDAVDGVNIHTFPRALNSLFDFTHSGGHWAGIVHPLYYGALMFARAAPAGARLLPVSPSTGGSVRAWATRGRDGREHVVLINDALGGGPAAVSVRIDGRSGPAAVQRLKAPGIAATGGVTLGGRTFGAQTATGVLPPPVPQTITPHGGVYTLGVPAASAVLLTLPAG